MNRESETTSVMISDDSISNCSERGFSDMEQGLKNTNIRGILRISQNIEKEQNDIFKIAKGCTIVFALIICIPIVLLDLIYAYTDKTCVNIYPKQLNINMKIYLLVSGYCGASELVVLLYKIITLNKEHLVKDDDSFIILFIDVFYRLFITAWTIVGAIIFWGTLYNMDVCSRTTFNYLFITLIIKLVLISNNLIKKTKHNKK